jgi:hypothetical protein
VRRSERCPSPRYKPTPRVSLYMYSKIPHK